MEIQWLRYFVETADARSVSRAADRLGVAQPTLSVQLRKLERSLGRPLFDRLGRGVALTEAGRALYPRARRILAEVRGAEEQLADDVASGRGALALGAIPTMAPYLLPHAVGALRAAFPEAHLTLREDLTERLIDALVEHELDAAILAAPVEHDALALESIGRERLVVALPPAHPLARHRTIPLSALRDEPTVTLDALHCLGRQIDGLCALRRVRPQVVCRTAQLATVVEMVGMGLGLSVVPAMAAAADRAGRCVYRPIAGARVEREIVLAWHRDRSRGPLGHAAGRVIREALQQ